MPLIKSATTAAPAAGAAVGGATAAMTTVAATQQQAKTATTTACVNGATRMTATTTTVPATAIATATTKATRTTSGKVRTTLAKSVPATPVQPKSPATHFISSSPEYKGGHATAEREDDEEEHYNNCSEYMPHSYPNFTFDLSEDDSNEIDDELELDDSSLAMITPPPPYVDTPLQYVRAPPLTQQRTRRAATAPPPPTRKKLFQNREIFNINTPTITPSSSSFASAITPTKLSAAAAAMFAAPQMVQLNRKWTQLHRKRRRRNSSSGDSKELDKLVLQSVDWDENDIY